MEERNWGCTIPLVAGMLCKGWWKQPALVEQHMDVVVGLLLHTVRQGDHSMDPLVATERVAAQSANTIDATLQSGSEFGHARVAMLSLLLCLDSMDIVYAVRERLWKMLSTKPLVELSSLNTWEWRAKMHVMTAISVLDSFAPKNAEQDLEQAIQMMRRDIVHSVRVMIEHHIIAVTLWEPALVCKVLLPLVLTNRLEVSPHVLMSFVRVLALLMRNWGVLDKDDQQSLTKKVGDCFLIWSSHHHSGVRKEAVLGLSYLGRQVAASNPLFGELSDAAYRAGKIFDDMPTSSFAIVEYNAEWQQGWAPEYVLSLPRHMRYADEMHSDVTVFTLASARSSLAFYGVEVPETEEPEENVAEQSVKWSRREEELLELLQQPKKNAAVVQRKPHTGYERKQETTKQQGLIVNASLVENEPNLGGLTRTCEIFGVERLEVSNMAIVKNKRFAMTSVTAELWQPMAQVQVQKLAEHLKAMHEQGYTIVAVEQTARSQMLTEYAFPEKTVLLLGREKSGVPADLLGMVDTCVEVPQFGVIRSLNVHVCASIVIWEYTRQHKQ